jgi:hypothetical protein
MRRLCLSLALLVLALPAAEWCAAAQATNDGALAVSGGEGTLVIQGRGVIFGSFAQGSMVVVDYRPTDPTATIAVSGAVAESGQGVTTYTGTGVRFLLPAGRYTIQLFATGINVSAVGHGTVGAAVQPPDANSPASTTATTSSGWIAVNGGKPVPFDKVSGPVVFGGSKGV